MTRRVVIFVLLVTAAVCLFQSSAQAQCAMCVTALENSPEGKGMAASFNNGILFLLFVPYALFGTFGVVMFRAHRRKKIAAQQADNPYIPRPSV